MTREVQALFATPPPVSPDGEAREMASLLRRWVRQELHANRAADRDDPRGTFKKARAALRDDLELRGLLVDAAKGGLGWACPTCAPGLATLVLEIGRGDATLAFSTAVDLALQATVQQASEEATALNDEVRRWALSKDSAPALVVLPGAGIVDEASPLLQGRAIRALHASSRGQTTIRGRDLRVMGDTTSGPGMAGVVCADASGLPALAVMPTDRAGLRRATPPRTAGLDAVALGTITLDRVRISSKHVLEGADAPLRLRLWLDLLLGAASLGAALDFFDILIAWAEDRPIKGGGLLRDNPLCADVLATSAEEIATAQLHLFDLAAMIAAEGVPGERLRAYGGLLGRRIQNGAFTAIDRGLELMGSAGYAVEWHAERHWRDVKSIQSLQCGVGAEALIRMDAARWFAGTGEE